MSADAVTGLGLLGHPHRRHIFLLLAQGPSSVGELAGQLPITRPAVSQHLKLLKDCGLVRSEARGTRRIYRIDPDGVLALIDYLDRALNAGLVSRRPGSGG